DGAQLKLFFGPLQKLVSQVQSALLNAQALAQLNRLPVGELGLVEKSDQGSSQIVFGLANPAARNQNGQPIDVRAAVPDQRLCETHRQATVIRRVEVGESAVGSALDLGKPDLILCAVLHRLGVVEVDGLAQSRQRARSGESVCAGRLGTGV